MNKYLQYLVLTLCVVITPIIFVKSFKTKVESSSLASSGQNPFEEQSPSVYENPFKENNGDLESLKNDLNISRGKYDDIILKISTQVADLKETLEEKERQLEILEKKVWLLVIVSNENQNLNSKLEEETSREERERIFFDQDWKINKLPETMSLDENQEERLRNELSDAKEGDSKYKPIIYTRRTKLQDNKWYKTGDKGVIFWDGENWKEVKPTTPNSPRT